jgi:hypothetical protein
VQAWVDGALMRRCARFVDVWEKSSERAPGSDGTDEAAQWFGQMSMT